MGLVSKLGKVCLGLAAGAMCINPALAQQSDSTVPSNASQAGERSADKEVTLAPDGSFRAAVLTRSGFLVAGANLELTPKNGEAVKVLTGTRGMAVVSGLKPGWYRVNVDSPQGSYHGTLQVRATPVTKASLTPPPLVTFMLTPAQCPDQKEECRRPAPCLEELEAPEEVAAGPGILCPVLGLTGVGAAIALPLSLAHRHHRRASP